MQNNFIRFWLPLYLYAGLIFYLSALSHPLPRVPVPFFDKFLHLSEFFIFGALACRAFKNSTAVSLRNNFRIFSIMASVAYGASDEFHQLFVPGRDMSILDLIADSIGGTMGVFFYGGYKGI